VPSDLRARVLSLDAAVRADAVAGAQAARDALGEARALPRTPETQAIQSIARARLAQAHVQLGDPRAAFDEGLTAERLAVASGDVDAQAIAWTLLSLVLYRVGQLAEARRWARKAVALPRLSPVHAVRALINVAAMLRAEGRLDEATEAFDQLMVWRGRVDVEMWCTALINAASCWHQVDRPADALAALQEASELLPPGQRPDLEAWIDTIEAWAAWAGNQLPRATAAARAALDPARDASVDRLSSAARALAAIASRDPHVRAEAIEATESVVGEAERQGARQQALDLHLALVDLHESDDTLVAAVRHLRAARRSEGQLADDARRLSAEREDLRVELARMQVEADSLRSRREELAAANAALAAADGERSRLLRTLAHDLRNPLMAIVASVEMVNAFDPLEVRSHLDTVEAAVERMESVLRGAARPPMDSARPEVDAGALASRTADALRSLAERKGQRLVVDAEDGATMHADPDAVGRILDNLVTNALKYGGEGTEARVVVSSTDTRVDLEVLDEGPGFPDLDAEDGLLLGTQLAARTTGNEDSWGIGLHTVYRLVAEQGGILAVGNRPEGGALVRVSLPR